MLAALEDVTMTARARLARELVQCRLALLFNYRFCEIKTKRIKT